MDFAKKLVLAVSILVSSNVNSQDNIEKCIKEMVENSFGRIMCVSEGYNYPVCYWTLDNNADGEPIVDAMALKSNGEVIYYRPSYERMVGFHDKLYLSEYASVFPEDTQKMVDNDVSNYFREKCLGK